MSCDSVCLCLSHVTSVTHSLVSSPVSQSRFIFSTPDPGSHTVKASHPLSIARVLFGDAESLRGARHRMFVTSLDVTRNDGDRSHTARTTWTPSHNIPEIGQKFKPSQSQLDMMSQDSESKTVCCNMMARCNESSSTMCKHSQIPEHHTT